ncbi:probable Ufm1-specific protease 1 [Anopheles marshallii]|uniref:probable Ufm1-specific protease 1 n=1 Tax=Anopheles marshallii TaxID=1521116 RepID=UPI00237BF8D9|nr:probable Ufm1-specific protease 1 [Anopheles marshallii]
MEEKSLLLNVHSNLEPPKPDGNTFLMRGNYHYYHYGCDGFQDMGWGCGYRTLQSICSWIIQNGPPKTASSDEVPNIPTIQQKLVEIKDKPERFFGSREWIGTLEAIYVIDTLYDVSCKVLHIARSDSIAKHADTLRDYFEQYGGLIMMGGDMDAASKGIAGIHVSVDQDVYLLVVDPHFVGRIKTKEELYTKQYVKWQKVEDFVDSSFYNLCLPMLKSRELAA